MTALQPLRYNFRGAGVFSDGKLPITIEFGGVLDEYVKKDEL
ncbi:hypothetical protein [Fonticella tunisiensis]|nr:hypothetical protein [Fonticella tunisiensis]